LAESGKGSRPANAGLTMKVQPIKIEKHHFGQKRRDTFMLIGMIRI
jgi:hypothetical protein